MKHYMYALPLAFLAAAAVAQTDTTSGTDTTTSGTDTTVSAGAGASAEMFGASWPLSVGTTFLTDDESGMLRPQEELSSGWQSLSQTDRDLVKADCKMFMEDHGGDSADAGAATTGSADASTTTTGSADADGSADAGATATGDASGGAAVVPAGYTEAEMLSICKAVEGL